MDTDDSLLDRFRPKPPGGRPAQPPSSIEAMSAAAEAETRGRPAEAVPEASPHAATADDGDPLPGPGDAYKAHARPSNKHEPMIGLLLDEGTLEVFSYSDLQRVRLLKADQPGGGPVLLLKFTEPETTHVLVQGGNLLLVAHYIRQHRIAWLRELPAGKRAASPHEPVIMRISLLSPEAGGR